MVTQRQVGFSFDSNAVPQDWYDGDPFITTHLDALSLLFPEGERFFVRSVAQLRGRVTDPQLGEDVAGFVGQEAMHGSAHRDFNRMLIAHGFTAAPKVDAWLRRFLRRIGRVLPARSQLAVTCALEHFTAILAEALLGDARMRDAMDPSIRPLWLWHALEESEHKAVAYDVYRAAGGGYVNRVAVMAVTTAVFFAVVIAVHTRLLAQRRLLLKPWRWISGLWRMWVWPGHFTRLIPAYLHYYRPGFHPSRRDTRPLQDHWRRVLFGEDGVPGELSGQLRGARGAA